MYCQEFRIVFVILLKLQKTTITQLIYSFLSVLSVCFLVFEQWAAAAKRLPQRLHILLFLLSVLLFLSILFESFPFCAAP